MHFGCGFRTLMVRFVGAHAVGARLDQDLTKIYFFRAILDQHHGEDVITVPGFDSCPRRSKLDVR